MAQRLTSPTTATRFGASSLHQRDSRSQLFAGYTGDQTRRPSPGGSSVGGGYGYGHSPSPGAQQHLGVENNRGFRPATPNKRGQYSDAVLNELESQNDEQVAGILGKVRVLKDVSSPPSPSTCLSIPSPSYWERISFFTDGCGSGFNR